MPSKVGSLAAVGIGAYGASSALNAFVLPSGTAVQQGAAPKQRESRHLRRQRLQYEQAMSDSVDATSSMHGATWALGAAAVTATVAAAGRRAPKRGHAARRATATAGETVFTKMPASVKPGVVTGKALVDLLNYAKENEFAIPGVNIGHQLDQCLHGGGQEGRRANHGHFFPRRRPVHCRQGGG
mmetsp:Transcript_97241/g.302776  ORF Transcript_97241/g.302776 Transcript_97241/m.302776 type:complete len:184 (-) Transcript_97241:82-633(-)